MNEAQTYPDPSFLHRLAHLFRMHLGRVVNVRLDGHHYIGFQCATCGSIGGLLHMEACGCHDGAEVRRG